MNKKTRSFIKHFIVPFIPIYGFIQHIKHSYFPAYKGNWIFSQFVFFYHVGIVLIASKYIFDLIVKLTS